jgi:hypothetical protein
MQTSPLILTRMVEEEIRKVDEETRDLGALYQTTP